MTLVASFSCVCCALDEVREPAPERVHCWKCKGRLTMRRWNPGYDPPVGSARPTTEKEAERAAREGRT